MKKSKLALGFMTISILTLALASGCSNKKMDAGETTAMETQAETQSSEAAESTGESMLDSLELNYDLANVMGSDMEEIVANFGEPKQKEDLDKVSIYTYEKENRIFKFNFYRDVKADADLENSCFFIKAAASDMWGLKEKVTKKDFIAALNIEAEDLDGKEEIAGNGEIGDKVIVFEYEGYFFVVALDEEGVIGPESLSGMYTLETPYVAAEAAN